jgi:hypothetical protein
MFSITGQGIFVFEKESDFTLYNGTESDGLHIFNKKNSVSVVRVSNGEKLEDKTCMSGSTWFSLDSQNQCLYAGIGEARMDTVVYMYQFEKTKENKKFLESISSVSRTPDKFIKDPITKAIPLLVKNTCTMHEIAHNKYMPKSHLSPSSQKLYDSMYKTVLNTPDFKDFAKAIDHSIATPGCWCHEKIKEKASEFGNPNIKETYLRITLGQNNGESPGIPYVMEIWPVDHFSPIHNHAGASAIIHVLRGKINVNLYPYLGAKEHFASADFKKGDITWISPTLNQTHKLQNKGRKTCVTLQCYMYEEEDNRHYDYFDYEDSKGEIKHYEPDSDMDFVEFKKRMQKEWSEIPVFKKLFS